MRLDTFIGRMLATALPACQDHLYKNAGQASLNTIIL